MRATQNADPRRASMPRINWTRLLIGGIVTTVIMFGSDGFLHENLLNTDWKAIYDNLKSAEPHHSATGVLYFVVFELGRGFISLFLYALMRSFFGAGPKT